MSCNSKSNGDSDWNTSGDNDVLKEPSVSNRQYRGQLRNKSQLWARLCQFSSNFISYLRQRSTISCVLSQIQNGK